MKVKGGESKGESEKNAHLNDRNEVRGKDSN